jgi:hypothetical protein
MNPKADKTPLEYEPATGRLRGPVRWRWVAVIVRAAVAGVGYRWRAEIAERWTRGRLLYAQRQCLTFHNRPGRVVYDDDPAAAKELLARGGGGYIDVNGAACAVSPAWDDFFARLGRETFLWPKVAPGATVFLHELRTAEGRGALIHVTATAAANRNRSLTVVAVNPGDWATTPGDYEIGLQTEAAFMIGSGDAAQPKLFIPLKDDQRLRLYAGAIDPNDASRVLIPYEVDGQRGVCGFRLLSDPDRPGRLTLRTEQVKQAVAGARNGSKLP